MVRLREGDYARATTYELEPSEVVAGFVAAGATRVHVVDLDAARGRGDNAAAVRGLVETAGIQVQVGGGVRDLEMARSWLEGGAAFVVLGTMAAEEPELAEEIARRWPDRVYVGVDARGDSVSVRGWGEDGGVGVAQVLDRYAEVPVAGYIYTQIERDGMLTGQDTGRLAAVVAASRHPVVASGGIAGVEGIRAAALAGAAGVIVGRALYEGRADLRELIGAA